MNSEIIVLLLFSILYTGMVFYIVSPLISGNSHYADNKDIKDKSEAIQQGTIRNLIYELEIDYELGLVEKNDYRERLAHLNNTIIED